MILCHNARLLTLDKLRPVLERQQILVDNGVIAAVGKDLKIAGLPIRQRIDCTGKIVMPGLINTHSHLTEILQRSFRDNLRMEVWRGYRARTEELANPTAAEIGAAAALACAEMLKNGVTAVVDHFSTRPGLSEPKMMAIVRAFEQTGIRGVLTPSLLDRDFVEIVAAKRAARAQAKKPKVPWQEQVLPMLSHLKQSAATVSLMLGPSSPFSCSDELVREVVEMAEQHDLGIHTHLLETKLQRWGGRQLYPEGLGKRMQRLGLFSQRLSAAHCVWVNEREMDAMAAAGVNAVHNPASNLKLGSGIAPVVAMKKRGINVSLGTDGGDTSDSYTIFEQIRLAALLSRVNTENSDEWVTALDALRMGTINGAQAVPAWRGKIGKIAKGYRADLVILRPNLRLTPAADVVNQLVFCESGQSVDTVMVDGKIVVKDGRLLSMREEEVMRKVLPISRRMQRHYRALVHQEPPQSESTVRQLYRKAFDV
ncbi:MAG: amidohydrolase family protein [Deltaproteobacteria bacterium]|nr:amidohydrolase family protein [Deltaproteobacteria bacterium]